jgi:two-component system, NarL family, response regulator NreC
MTQVRFPRRCGVPIRILLADDHGVLRAGLKALLDGGKGFHVVAEAWEGDQVLRLAAKLQPDIVLLDLNMPGPGNIEVTRRIIEVAPKARVLVLTAYEESGMVREVLKAGASGYIIKRAVESELLNAISAVHRGEVYVHPFMMRALLDPPVQDTVPTREEDRTDLTRREVEVLRFIARGYTNRQIGESLALSVRTVESHRANLMGKLGLQTRIQLVRYATEQKLLQ